MAQATERVFCWPPHAAPIDVTETTTTVNLLRLRLSVAGSVLTWLRRISQLACGIQVRSRGRTINVKE